MLAANFLGTFIWFLLSALWYAIIGRALLSWFPISQQSPFYPLAVVLHQVTEPILGPLRRIIPTFGMIDISPLVALLLISFVRDQLLPAFVQSLR